MAKFIKLTNQAQAFKDTPIHINVDHITAIYDQASEPGGSLRTIVYGGPTGIHWEVEESSFEILKMIRTLDYDS